MDKLLAKARRDRERFENRPSVFGLKGWRSVLYYLYYRNRYFFVRETGMWLFNLLEVALAAWFLGGLRVRGFALAGRYVQLICLLWGAVTFAERILVSRYHAAGKPERIARVVATFIQLGIGAGILLFLGLYAAAPVLVAPGSTEDHWTLLFFQHRAALLIPELISGSIFAGAYTLSRMYRPLSITFTVRLAVVLSNVFLFPVFGEPVLLVNLYIPRIIDLGVTAWVAREWAFKRHRVPRLPLFSPPRFNVGLLREVLPYIGGRALGVLFATGYTLIILQVVTWVLPREMVFYFLFYQTMGLLYLVPKRLGRSIYFDITQLLIWNRLGVLKDYVRKLDRVSAAAGVAVSVICALAGLAARSGWGTDRFVSLAPLIFAAVPFLLFHPQSAVWQSVRNAAGEIRFNNGLLLVTNYLVALPVNVWILLRLRGEFNVVQSYGMSFVVVTHTLLFVRVLLVDGAMEAVRALFSRFHIFRFRWAENSPLRVTRSLMDAELSFAKNHALTASFSRDLSDLWGERFLRARDQGLSSLPYFGYTVARFLRNPSLMNRGFGLVRMTLDRRSRAEWKPGGEAAEGLANALRPVDSVCRIAAGRLALFLPCLSDDELRRRVADLNAASGIFLREISYLHSSAAALSRTADVLQWITSSDQSARSDFPGPHAPPVQHAWTRAPDLFRLRKGRDDDAELLFTTLCNAWRQSGQTGVSLPDFAATDGVRALSDYLEREVSWQSIEHWTGRTDSALEDVRLAGRVVRYMDIHRTPDFHAFLRTDALHLFPLFFRTNLAGLFVYAPHSHGEQARLIRVAAAFYLWATLRSVENTHWEDESGLTIAPVFTAALEDARKLNQTIGIPFTHEFVRKPRHTELRTWVEQMKRTRGPGALIRQHGRRFEVLFSKAGSHGH